MSLQNTTDGVPVDVKLKEKLENESFYKNAPLTKILLSIVENDFNTKETVLIDKSITLEHIMPQNDKNKLRRQHVGSDYDLVYLKRIHQIGNLTLTGYNSELSDNSFPSKKALLENSKFKILNEDVINQNEWKEIQINNRTVRLTKKIITALVLPEEFNLNNIIKTNNSLNEYSLADNFSLSYQNFVCFSLFDEEKIYIVSGSGREFYIKVLAELYTQQEAEFFYLMTDTTYKKILGYANKAFRAPKRLSDSEIYIETNLSLDGFINNLRKIFNALEIEYDNLKFFVEPK